MRLQDTAIAAYHDPRLAVLSILISILAAYAARDLIERLRDAIGRAWIIWLICGAIVDGVGIWSMHYTAILGFHLPVAILYDSPTVLLSLLIGILGSAAMLFVVGRGSLSPASFWELWGFRDCRSGQLCAVYRVVTNLKSDKTVRTTIWHLSVIWLTSDLMVRIMDKP